LIHEANQGLGKCVWNYNEGRGDEG